jgi:hypothetical protein
VPPRPLLSRREAGLAKRYRAAVSEYPPVAHDYIHAPEICGRVPSPAQATRCAYQRGAGTSMERHSAALETARPRTQRTCVIYRVRHQAAPAAMATMKAMTTRESSASATLADAEQS